MNLILFIVAGLLSICGALGVVLAKQPVHQVISTIVNFIGLAALYLSLSAEFMAVIQLMVYGGAVMILFLFVIALLTAKKDPIERDQGKLAGQTVAGWALGGGVLLTLVIVGLVGQNDSRLANIAESFGGVTDFGRLLLTTHLLAFELTAFVLMVAVIGVVILVGRQKH